MGRCCAWVMVAVLRCTVLHCVLGFVYIWAESGLGSTSETKWVPTMLYDRFRQLYAALPLHVHIIWVGGHTVCENWVGGGAKWGAVAGG